MGKAKELWEMTQEEFGMNRDYDTKTPLKYQIEESEITLIVDKIPVDYSLVDKSFPAERFAFRAFYDRLKRNGYDARLKEKVRFDDGKIESWVYVPFNQFPGANALKIAHLFGKDMKISHQKLVEEAVKEGKPVPEEVLADYPELAGKTPEVEEVEEQKMGKVEKPPVDVRHICKHNAEIITKLKDADWIERPLSGCLTNSPNDIAYITDFKSFEGNLEYSFDDYSVFFQLKTATYKEWKEVEFIPYNTKYGINLEKIIEVLRILHGGYNAKIMGEVVLGFTPVTWWSAKPIIVFMPYKDDYAVFIVAPLMGSDGADLELEDVTIDETISFVEPVRVPLYYDLKTQTIGYSYNDKILSVDEFEGEWNRKHEGYEKRKAEPLEIDKIIENGKNDALLQYHFGGWGGKLYALSGYLRILGEPGFSEEERESAKENAPKMFAWIKKKYDQIPFSELSKSPFYDDFKPLFEISKLLSALEEELEREPLDIDKIESIMGSLGELSTEYGETVDKYYKELTGKDLGAETVETRALLEYRSKEQVLDQARWLQEHGIEPNSFEKAAMDYYGVEVPEEEPPWRRLIDVIKELKKEHGLEVPEDIAIAAAMEVGIENPEDLIYELKRDGILYSPAKGLIARVEIEKPPPAKEPWMMTKEEWIRTHIKNVDKLDKWVKQAELGETVEVLTTEIDESFPVGKVLIYGNVASTFPSTFDEPSKTIYINIDKPSDYVSEILNIKDRTIQVYYALLHEVEHLRWAIEGKPLNPYSPETQYEKYYSHPSEVAAREASDAFFRSLLDAHRKAIHEALKEGKPVPEEVLKDYPDLKKPTPFDWGGFIKDLEVKHYIGYRTEMAYGLGGRNLRSVVKYEIEELENTDIIDWTGVSDYIAMIDALYAHGYTEAVWLCKDEQHVIDYYCDGDPACPIEKYEIRDGILLSDLGEDGQLVAYQPKKVRIEEPGALSLSELKQKYLAIGWDEFVDEVFKGKRKIEPCVEYVDLPHLLVHKITVGPAEEVKYGAVWDVKSYDKDGNVLVSKGFKTEREAFIDFYSYIRDLIKQEQAKEEIPEEKWENVTKEKLEEIRRTSKFSEKYAISQAKAAKKVSTTEETVYEKLPDELDLGPYSEVLLYTPVEEIRYLPKAEHAAFIKLVDRGWFQVYRVSKPVSDKYPSGFTYVLKKTKEEEKPPELLPKIPEEGITEDWMEEVIKIDNKVTPEIVVISTGYAILLTKYIPELKDYIPFYTIERKTIPEVEECVEVLRYENVEWVLEDIVWSTEVKRNREIWYKEYTEEELRDKKVDEIREIAKIKNLSTKGKKSDLIARITAKPPKERYFWKEKEVSKEEYERLKREEEEKDKAEIEKRIKPLISEAEAAINECDKGFETCLEFCDGDLEECYDRCHEEYEDTKDIEKCQKECEKERDKCHDKCEEGARECYEDSAKEVIGEDIEEGDITKAEEDLEMFMDYISDELYKKLAEKLPKKVVEEERVKVRVLEDIPTFMGTDGEIYELKKGDIVELPKSNADVLCERGVAEPFVEIKPPEEVVPEKVKPTEVVKPPVEERTEIQEDRYEYFKKEIAEADVEAYRRGYLDELRRKIGEAYTKDELLLADGEELHKLIDLKRDELEAEIRKVIVPEKKTEDIVTHPSAILVTGKRRSGKTALGYHLLEISEAPKKYVIGIPEKIWQYLPPSITPLPLTEATLENLPEDAIIFFDESSLFFFARESGRTLSKLMDKLILISAQRGQTLIFSTHNLRKLDVGIVMDCDIIFFKEPSLLHTKFERPEIRKLTGKAMRAFEEIPEPGRVKYAYVFSADYEGLVETPLPSFWREELSFSWKGYEERTEIEEKAAEIKEAALVEVAQLIELPYSPENFEQVKTYLREHNGDSFVHELEIASQSPYNRLVSRNIISKEEADESAKKIMFEAMQRALMYPEVPPLEIYMWTKRIANKGASGMELAIRTEREKRAVVPERVPEKVEYREMPSAEITVDSNVLIKEAKEIGIVTELTDTLALVKTDDISLWYSLGQLVAIEFT